MLDLLFPVLIVGFIAFCILSIAKWNNAKSSGPKFPGGGSSGGSGDGSTDPKQRDWEL